MTSRSSRAYRRAPSWIAQLLGCLLFVVPTLALRIWIIRHFPEPDTDAAGHLGIARAVIADPLNVAVHWVYLPAYHFILAAFLLLGLDPDAIRLVNCALAALVPWLVLVYAERSVARSERASSRHVPWMAAAFCAISPLVNLLGTSAQQETLFTIAILLAVGSIDAGRPFVAGFLLALASMVRYEAWGAVALLAGLQVAGRIAPIAERLPRPIARAARLPLAITAMPLAAIGAWLLAHRLREGEWLGVLRELYRYTHAQRDTFHRGILWFPVEQPLFVFGSVGALLFFAGLRRAWRPSHVVPLGIYLFLLCAYLCKGALGSARYYESLVPFVALAAAHGTAVVGARWRWLAPAIFVAAALQLGGLSTEMFLWTWPPKAAQVATREVRAAPPIQESLGGR